MKKIALLVSSLLLFCIAWANAPLSKQLLPLEDKPQTHTVREGETLASIAQAYYGNGKLYTYLAKFNHIPNPNRLIAGRVLIIPPPPKEILAEMKSLPLEAVIPEVTKSSSAVSDNTDMAQSTETTSSFYWIKEANTAFKSGETLKFSIRWQFINVGSASMGIEGVEDVNGRKAYHIVTKAKSAPFFDNFYKVRDTNESWMDMESLCSLKFACHISEGGYKRDETVIMDHENKKFTIVESGKSGDIPRWVKDILSSIYYLRTKELTIGSEYLMDAHSSDKSWPLKVKVLRREKVSTPAGSFDCIVVQPSLRDDSGIFRSQGNLEVWLTNDSRKIPVLMRSKIAVGAIEARLAEMKGTD